MRKQNADDDLSILRKDTRGRGATHRYGSERIANRPRAHARMNAGFSAKSRRSAARMCERQVINEKLYAPSPKVPLN